MSEKATRYQMREFAYHIQGIDDILHKMEATIEKLSLHDLNLNSDTEQAKVNKKLLKIHQKIARLEVDLRIKMEGDLR